MFVGRWSFQTVVRQGGSPLRMWLTIGGRRSTARTPPTVSQRGKGKQKTWPHTANTDYFFQDRFWFFDVSCVRGLETITTVGLLTFCSHTLMALFILMACCNPISGDLSLFLMASTSHCSIPQTRFRWGRTRCAILQGTMSTQVVRCLFCHAPTSVWLYVKWYILSYWSFLLEWQAGLSGSARLVCLLKGHTVRAVCVCQASVFCVIQGSLWLSGHCGPFPSLVPSCPLRPKS